MALTDAEKMTNLRAAMHRGDMLQFVTGVLEANPEPHQVEAIQACMTHSHVAIRAAHDQGKTAMLAWRGIFHLLTRFPCKIPVAANSDDQLRDVTWAEITTWMRRLPADVLAQYELGLERIYLRSAPEECFMVGRTANRSNPEALQGFHSPNLLFLLEEASGMMDLIFEIASGAMSSKDSQALMIANPTKSTGYFKNAFTVNRWLWHGLHWPWRKNPWSNPHYPEQMAREYGDHSNVYRVRVLGEFPTTADNAVISLADIEAALVRDVDITDRRAMVWGLDIARFGDDRCALVKRRGNYTYKPRVWRQKDLMHSTGLVWREYLETPEEDKPVAINADVIGIGAGVVDRLRELGAPVFGVNVGETATDPDRFARQRDELWWSARDHFARRDNKIEAGSDDLVTDLAGPTYKLLSTGKIQVESKDEMKKRGLKSPDVGDAFCLTFAGGEFAADYRRHTHADTTRSGDDPMADVPSSDRDLQQFAE